MIERQEKDGIVTLRLAHGKASAMDVELCHAIDEAWRVLRLVTTISVYPARFNRRSASVVHGKSSSSSSR